MPVVIKSLPLGVLYKHQYMALKIADLPTPLEPSIIFNPGPNLTIKCSCTWKLVISTSSSKITLTSDEGATVDVTLDSTSYECGTGVTGSKTIKATSAVAKSAGSYKGTAKFTASVVSTN